MSAEGPLKPWSSWYEASSSSAARHPRSSSCSTSSRRKCSASIRSGPQTEIPMHRADGYAIAFFVSRWFQALPRDVLRSSRQEFSLDRLAGTNVQVSLASTTQDMAMGMLGAVLVITVRVWQLGAGRAEIREWPVSADATRDAV